MSDANFTTNFDDDAAAQNPGAEDVVLDSEDPLDAEDDLAVDGGEADRGEEDGASPGGSVALA